MRRYTCVGFLFVALLTARCGPARPKSGGDELGNGGDQLSKLFELGRSKAAEMLTLIERLEDDSFPLPPPDRAGEVKRWYVKNRVLLRDDVQRTPPFRWVTANENGACGQTGAVGGAFVYLSYRDCRRISRVEDAAVHLIGESVHHLGVRDDSFAALVAVAVGRAWDKHDSQPIETPDTKLLFERGRLYIEDLLAGLAASGVYSRPGSLVDERDRSWLAENTTLLRARIRTSPHHWEHVHDWRDELEEGTCTKRKCVFIAWSDKHVTWLSPAGCALVRTRKMAGELLLHGALHERLGDDERRVATLVAFVFATARDR